MHTASQDLDTKGAEITIQFSADGKVSGSGGCNSFVGSCEAGEGQKLTLSQVAATLKLYEPAVSDRETHYLNALKSVASDTLDGSTRLHLSFDNDQSRLSYQSGPVTLPGTGGADGTFAIALGAALLCLLAGLWLQRARRIREHL